MGTPGRVLFINGSGLNCKITKEEVENYINMRRLTDTLSVETEAIEEDFESRLALGAKVEAGAPKLELPYVVSRGTGYYSLKAATAK